MGRSQAGRGIDRDQAVRVWIVQLFTVEHELTAPSVQNSF